MVLDAQEIIRVNDFYKKLRQLLEVQQNCLDGQVSYTGLHNKASLDTFSGFISPEDLTAVEEPTASALVIYRVIKLNVEGRELAKMLA